MNCDFVPVGDADPVTGKITLRCSWCDNTVRVSADASAVWSNCRAWERPPEPELPPPGLGDRVARMLAAVGITKRRYAMLRGRRRIVGGMHCWFETLPEGEATCGCEQRRETLNKIGSRVGEWIRATLISWSGW